MINTLSALGAVLIYLAVAAWLLRSLSISQSREPGKSILLGLCAVILHGYALFHAVFTPEGLNMSFFYALSLVGWISAFILILAAFNKPVLNLSIAVFPFAALALIMQFAFPGEHNEPVGSWKLQTHILFSMFGLSTLFLAAMQAILLSIQDNHLHKHHPGGFVRALPPLRTMESLLFEIITLGFLLLSVALVTGILFVDGLFSRGYAHKTLFSMVAWSLFAILLVGRVRFGWRGRFAMGWTIAGLISLFLAYFGTKMVLELVLGR